MPKYEMFIQRTLTLMTSVIVNAKDETKAKEKTENRIESGDFGDLSWNIVNSDKDVEWTEQNDDITIEEVE
jgi:hypothetical protein